MEPTRPRTQAFLGLVLLSTAVVGLLHARSFATAHDEGDEVVYLALARQMNWDLSHYSTRDLPSIRAYPYSIYRQPLFHQPPLFPLILKIGGTIGSPVVAGLVFANLSMALLLVYAWRWLARTGVDPSSAASAFAGLTFCPLLLASTTLLHLDGLLGIYLACALIATIEALDRPSFLRSVVAGLLWAIALNLRYNALIALPLIPLFQAYQLLRLGRGPEGWRALIRPRHWLAFAVVVATVLLLGLPHYYRVYATYGTLLPGRFIVPDPDIAEASDYLRLITSRPPWRMAVLLATTFPILLAFLTPLPYLAIGRGLRRLSWEPMPLVAFLLLMPLEYAFSYQHMRFFAAELPLLYLGMPCLIESARGRSRPALLGVCAVTLLSMVVTGFARTVASPPDAVEIIPAIYYYLPWLMRGYR